jgi:iron complex outermembrane recepter protein
MLQKLLFCFVMLYCSFVFGQFKISGQVVDENNNPVTGCHIHARNKNATSNFLGDYSIDNLQKGKTTIFVSGLGFKSIEKTIFIEQNNIIDFKLFIKVNNLDDVIVNQKRNTENNSILEQKIKIETIEKYSNKSLGDVMREVTGVSVLRTGSTIVKPVINGLHSSRVPIINNKVRIEDQQWGSEHAPNFDVNAAGKITVIKGASALQYSGDAVGGIVIIEPVEVKKDTLFGKTITNFSSNGKGGTMSTSIHKGNFCDWSWNALGTFKYFGDRNSPNYVLSNSGNREINFSGDAKYIGKKFEITTFYSLFSSQIGILSASHIGNVTDLYNAINNQIPALTNKFSYAIKNPKQEVKHHLGKINFHYFIDETTDLDFQYSFQFNQRFEFDLRRSTQNKDKPALDLELTTHSVKIDFNKELENMKLKSGINADFQKNVANPATGVRPLIPNYLQENFGIYAIANKNVSSTLDLDFGLRYDFSSIEASKFYFKTSWNEQNYNINFNEFIVGENSFGNQWYTKPNFVFHNVSASVGLHKKFAKSINWYINISLATRNPNASEFFSDGLHHSTGQIELGDLGLKKEQSFKFSTAFQKKWSNFTIEANPYINRINNYMFLKPIGFEQTIRGAFPVWNYQQTNALLTGIDFNSEWKISEILKHQFSLATINGNDLTNNLPIIAMPPTTFSNKIHYSKKGFHGLVLELKNEVVFRQTQYPDNNFTTKIVQNNELVDVLVDISSPPKAYQLWDFYSEMKFNTFRNGFTTVSFSIQNILNLDYRDYLNKQRFFVDELGRNFQIQLKINY